MSKKLLSLFLTLVLTLSGGMVNAAGGKSVIQIADTGKVPVGAPFKVSARVRDPDGVDIVRLYFRAPHAKDFAFIDLKPKGGEYVGLMPAPAAGTNRIEQVVLVKDGSGNISQSSFFDTSTSIAKTGNTPLSRSVVVYSEVTPKPSKLDGFTGRYVIKTVPESLKLGVVAGLVKGSTAAKAKSGKTAAKTDEKSSEGLSTAAIAGIAGGAVALIAVAANGGGGGSDSTESGGQAELFGDVQVQLRWHNTADVDLHVTDPCGNRIDHLQRSAVCQGFTGSLDRNANDEHDPNPTTTPEENITWPHGAPKGHYRIRIRMQDDRGNGPTPVTVVIKDGDKPINTTSTTIGAAEGSSAYTGFDF